MAIVYLIPAPLNTEALDVIPSVVRDRVQGLRIFFVEDERNARRYLRRIGFNAPFEEVTLLPLNEHTTAEEISHYLHYLDGEAPLGIMSDAGLPAVADPGATIIGACHAKGVQVIPLSGPNSIMLALMSSGLNGQRFTFHGYIPVKQPARKQYLQKMETAARVGETQIFIETPYRNKQLFDEICAVVSSDMQLCIAMDITGPEEWIRTAQISRWKTKTLPPGKLPAVFLLGI